MITKSINQIEEFDSNPLDLYDMLMNAKKHAALTGAKVIMSKKPRGKFSVFDGYCKGYNIELIAGEKIVQAWHFAEDGWPDDHYSTCTFVFEKVNSKTKLTFTQTDVPEHKVEELENGWKEIYWNPMKAYLKNKE
jgi:activator of HSP90 ATPase